MGRKDWIGSQQSRLEQTYGKSVNLNAGTGGPSDLVSDTRRKIIVVTRPQDENTESEPKMRTITYYTGDE